VLLVSAFQPATITLDPPREQDALATAVVTSLRRDFGLRMTSNLPTVLVLGVATAGLAPLFLLLLRFRKYATGEKFVLEHVTELVQRDQQEVPELSSSTKGLASKWRVVTSAGLALACGAVALAVWHTSVSNRSAVGLWTSLWTEPERTAYGYTLVVVGCYLFFVYCALHAHAKNVDVWMRAFDEFITAKNQRAIVWDRSLPPFVAQDVFVFPSIAWVVTGLLLALSGCLWGLFMMLAAGAHRRYINEVSRDVRAQIADRIEQMRGRDAHATGS
jgi:hypothetical protein